ncbi:hypothetical protein ACFY7V_31320 [[Kitasatospora] papulosa]|uniref:Uncharacterized protein n=1 Tax=[Kitasatospora] papulosa TaxID=1464011 RepID=A0ABZ1JUY4_9ACTN|nr:MULTISPECIES: hypothetical protein [unclassified Streptomyces]MYT55098.1 hypothetical protein [Streptomyces sp. SID7815]
MPMFNRVAGSCHGRELDTSLLAASEVRLESGIVERIKVKLEPNPLDGHEGTSRITSLNTFSKPIGQGHVTSQQAERC